MASILLILIAWFVPMPLWLSIVTTIGAVLRLGTKALKISLALLKVAEEED